jgi:hypothetical protein
LLSELRFAQGVAVGSISARPAVIMAAVAGCLIDGHPCTDHDRNRVPVGRKVHDLAESLLRRMAASPTRFVKDATSDR